MSEQNYSDTDQTYTPLYAVSKEEDIRLQRQAREDYEMWECMMHNQFRENAAEIATSNAELINRAASLTIEAVVFSVKASGFYTKTAALAIEKPALAGRYAALANRYAIRAGKNIARANTYITLTNESAYIADSETIIKNLNAQYETLRNKRKQSSTNIRTREALSAE